MISTYIKNNKRNNEEYITMYGIVTYDFNESDVERNDKGQIVKWHKEKQNNETKETKHLERRTENVGAFKELKVPMQMKSVKRVVQKYGVSLKGIKIKIQRDDENLINSDICGMAGYESQNRIDLCPLAFRDEEQLIKTIVHEKEHLEQYKEHGHKYVLVHIKEFDDKAEQKANEVYEEFQKNGSNKVAKNSK